MPPSPKKLAQRFGHSFDPRYIQRPADQLALHALVEIDCTKIEERLAFTRDNYRMMREELLNVVYWMPDLSTGMREQRAAA